MSATETPGEREPSDSEPEPRLRITGISKSFPNVRALEDVSLTVEGGEVVGLIGENGAGKSTLLRILTGVHPADDGAIYIDGEEVTPKSPRDASRKGISIVHQEQNILPNMRGYENLFLGMESRFTNMGVIDQDRMRSEGESVLDSLGIDIDLTRRVSEYSFTQQQMIQIARAFVTLQDTDHPIILLDEPTAGLEEDGREILFQRVNELRSRASFIFVSHELDEVLELADRIYTLKDGRVVDETDSNVGEEYLKRQMVGRETQGKFYKTDRQTRLDDEAETVLSARDLAAGDALEDASIDLKRGEILGVVGVEGSGKEDLGRTIAGIEDRIDGTVEFDGDRLEPGSIADFVDAGGGYIPKERKSEGLLLYQPLWLNISVTLLDLPALQQSIPFLDKVLTVVNASAEKRFSDRIIDEMNVKTPGRDTIVHELSGGNQQKVVIGRWLARESPVLVMDNVTRGIDVGAKEEVYSLLRDLTEDGVSILLISDELPEAIGLANRVAVMKNGTIQTVLDAPPDGKPDENDLIEEMI